MKIEHFRLTQLITAETLNYIIPHGEYIGQSFAFNLGSELRGHQILQANDNRLLFSINAEAMNFIIPEGEFAGQSLAYRFSVSLDGQLLLGLRDFYLASLIAPKTLNCVDDRKYSVASNLSRNSEGQRVLMAHEHRLGQMITADRLNAIYFQDEMNQGESIAFHLALSKESQPILAYNHYFLANLICEETLNMQNLRGYSLAYCLANHSLGLKILLAHHWRLVSQISLDVLHYKIIKAGQETSVATCLSKTDEGMGMLSFLNIRAMAEARRLDGYTFFVRSTHTSASDFTAHENMSQVNQK